MGPEKMATLYQPPALLDLANSRHGVRNARLVWRGWSECTGTLPNERERERERERARARERETDTTMPPFNSAETQLEQN